MAHASSANASAPPNAPPPLPIKILFVCLGNICRSPMAEGVFRSHISSLSPSPRYTIRASNIDSAGTAAYHVGSQPDPRTMDVLAAHGIRTYTHAARKVQPADFENFDYIFAMDEENLEDLEDVRAVALKRMRKREGAGSTNIPTTPKIPLGKAPDGLAHLRLFGAFASPSPPGQEEVGDPYYGGRDGFETAYEQVDRFSRNFLKWLDTAVPAVQT